LIKVPYQGSHLFIFQIESFPIHFHHELIFYNLMFQNILVRKLKGFHFHFQLPKIKKILFLFSLNLT